MSGPPFKSYPKDRPKSQNTLTLTLVGLSRGGAGIAKVQDGDRERIVFVPLTMPGDVVEAEIYLREKRYDFARVVRFISHSPMREKPQCSVFEKCGGCAWQHVPYSEQWRVKSEGVLNALARAQVKVPALRHSDWELFPAPEPYHYRNRIQLRESLGRFGFFARGSQELVPLPESGCAVARPEINELLGNVRVPNGVRNDQRGYRKLEIEVDSAGKTHETWNSPHAALGFRQVNDRANESMLRWIQSHLTPILEAGKNHSILDLYGGSGNLSRALWDFTERVELVDLSIPNGLKVPPHVKVHRESTAKWLLSSAAHATKKTYSRPVGRKIAILDPPREGIESPFKLILALKELQVHTLCFIHCDPDSHARDLHKAIQHGYEWRTGAIFDFFPQTPHVEVGAILSLRQ